MQIDLQDVITEIINLKNHDLVIKKDALEDFEMIIDDVFAEKNIVDEYHQSPEELLKLKKRFIELNKTDGTNVITQQHVERMKNPVQQIRIMKALNDCVDRNILEVKE